MPDTATSSDLPTTPCLRHKNRPGTPWCSACCSAIYDAIGDLPTLHERLLDTDGRDTRAKLIGGRTSIDPPSPSPRFDDANEIATTLADWAESWADYLDEQVTRALAWTEPVDAQPTLRPCCIAAAHRDTDADLTAHDPHCPWRRYVQTRGRADAERRGLHSTPLTPRAAATYLLRHRSRADLLSSPLAADLGRELRALHGKALLVLGGDENGRDEIHDPLRGMCPRCGGSGMYRVVGTEVVRCGQRDCGHAMTWDEYSAELERQKWKADRNQADRQVAMSDHAA